MNPTSYDKMLLSSDYINQGNNRPILQQSETYLDNNYYRYVGWDKTANNITLILFNEANLRKIQEKISQLTIGVAPENKRIIVPITSISGIISSVYENYRPETGGIYSRYTIASESPYEYCNNIINQSIEIIVSQINSTYGMIENNKKLTVWTTVLGDFNTHGLRSHSQIKVLEKKPDSMQFNMNY